MDDKQIRETKSCRLYITSKLPIQYIGESLALLLLCFIWFPMAHVCASLAPVVEYTDNAAYLSKRIKRLENELHYYTEINLVANLEKLQQETYRLQDKLSEQEKLIATLKAQQAKTDQVTHQKISLLTKQINHLKTSKHVASNSNRVHKLTYKKQYNQALSLMKKQHYKKAIALLENIIHHHKSSPYAANAYYWLGSIYQLNGQKQQSKQNFQKLIKLYPKNRYAKEAKQKLKEI